MLMVIEKPRPYWHVDAKWIVGLLTVAVLTVSLVVFGLFRLTDETRAPAFVNAVAKDLMTNPNSDFDASQLNRHIQPLYEKGSEGVAKAASSDTAQQLSISKQLEIFNVFTRKGHEQLFALSIVLGIVLALLLAGLAYFSYRAGRFLSPGIVILIVSLPGTMALASFKAGAQVAGGMSIGNFGPAVLGLIGEAFLPVYAVATCIGIILILTAITFKALKH